MIIPCGHRVLVRQLRVDEHDQVISRARKAGLEVHFDRNVKYQAVLMRAKLLMLALLLGRILEIRRGPK